MPTFQTHIGDLSRILAARIKSAGITQNVYLEGNPMAVQSVPDNFVVVTFPLTLRNKGVYQLHQVRIDFVAKDMENGRADVLALEDMTNKFLKLCPLHADRFTISSPYIRLRAGDGLGHHSWTIQADCLVNTTDEFYPYQIENSNTNS